MQSKLSRLMLLLVLVLLVAGVFHLMPRSRSFEVSAEEEVKFVAGEGDSGRSVMIRDMKKISIGTASRLHEQVVAKCLSGLPDNLKLQNGGPIGTYFYPRGQRLDDDDGSDCLRWNVYNNLVVFSFWVSLQETKSTVLHVDIDGTRLFINSDFIEDEKGLDDALPSLGKRSVREVLSRLTKKE